MGATLECFVKHSPCCFQSRPLAPLQQLESRVSPCPTGWKGRVWVAAPYNFSPTVGSVLGKDLRVPDCYTCGFLDPFTNPSFTRGLTNFKKQGVRVLFPPLFLISHVCRLEGDGTPMPVSEGGLGSQWSVTDLISMGQEAGRRQAGSLPPRIAFGAWAWISDLCVCYERALRGS